MTNDNNNTTDNAELFNARVAQIEAEKRAQKAEYEHQLAAKDGVIASLTKVIKQNGLKSPRDRSGSAGDH